MSCGFTEVLRDRARQAEQRARQAEAALAELRAGMFHPLARHAAEPGTQEADDA